MSEMVDRRRKARRSIDFFVQEHQDGKTFLHPAINLSVDGIYIFAASDRKIIDGETEMSLEFKLPNGELIEAQGRIVHVYQSEGRIGVGIRFSSFTGGSKDTIAAFLRA